MSILFELVGLRPKDTLPCDLAKQKFPGDIETTSYLKVRSHFCRHIRSILDSFWSNGGCIEIGFKVGEGSYTLLHCQICKVRVEKEINTAVI